MTPVVWEGDVVAAAMMGFCGVAASGLSALVWRRSQAMAGTALAMQLVAVAVWASSYAAELLSVDVGARLFWGDVKYVGIGALAPAWVCFVLAYTGRVRWVRPPLVAALAVEPVVLITLLALPGTSGLVRNLPRGAPDGAVVVSGPLFWAHLAYTATLMVAASVLFVGSLVRRSSAYWLQAGALVAATVVPLSASLLFNAGPDMFRELDLTPMALTGSGAVLTWGLFRQRLLRLTPVARGVLVERMGDPVLVLDAYGHLVDVNPAAARLLGADPARLKGRAGVDVLPDDLAPLVTGDLHEVDTPHEVQVSVAGVLRTFEALASGLAGRRGAAQGRLLVLRDVTERTRLERRLRELLAEQQRVAGALAQSLRPRALPQVPGLRVAARYRPAGSGREVGGDFYDVFRVGEEWGFVLGDVSGKGAAAAAVTASARYTLRAVAAAEPSPARALALLDRLLLGQLEEEVYLTVIHGWVRPGEGGAAVRVSLGGHAQPLLLGADGGVTPVGAPGSAIGLLGDPELLDTEVLLRPGDVLVLCTDGVAEARTGSAFFGEDGLVATLRGHAGQGADVVAEAVVREVLRFQGGDAADDIAVLALEVPLRTGV